MANAEVGDEQEREDPTVLELERRAAELLGQEEAVYLPTATMGNQIALAILGQRGGELIVEERAHIMVSELGGAAYHSGLQTRGLPGYRGRISAEQVRAAGWKDGEFWTPAMSVLALENTHNTAGGAVWPLDELRETVGAARELGLRTHLDGARLLNAAVASGVPASEIAGGFDTVTLCLSKGLGCPLGALIAGSRELMHRARIEKHRFGGAMRQAGIVAAAGLYALDHNVERLADDHARARRLAEGWAEAGLPVDLELVETNFVQLDVAALGLSVEEAIALVREQGVLLSQTRPGRAARGDVAGDRRRGSRARRGPPCHVRSRLESVSEQLDRLLQERQAERLPSVAAAVVRKGETVWSSAVGIADYAEEREATPGTQYRIGSITKTFTAVVDHAAARRGAARSGRPARAAPRRDRATARRRSGGCSPTSRVCSARWGRCSSTGRRRPRTISCRGSRSALRRHTTTRTSPSGYSAVSSPRAAASRTRSTSTSA